MQTLSIASGKIPETEKNKYLVCSLVKILIKIVILHNFFSLIIKYDSRCCIGCARNTTIAKLKRFK